MSESANAKKAKAVYSGFPPKKNTVPDVFILESLDRTDEKARRYEGRLLSEMLLLAGKNPKYFYFQSKHELPHLLALFRLSRYRYLHFSCHASDCSVATTTESMTYEEFAGYFDDFLSKRRLFMSACEVGNQAFVEAFASKTKECIRLSPHGLRSISTTPQRSGQRSTLVCLRKANDI